MSTERTASRKSKAPLDGRKRRVATIFHAYEHEYLEGVFRYAREAGWAMRAYIGSLPKRPIEVDGVLAYHWNLPDFVECIQSFDAPVVSLDRKDGRMTVKPDMVKAGQIAAEHLVDAGYKNIGFFSPGRDRFYDYQESFREAVEATDCNYYDIYRENLPEILNDLPRPMAVAVIDDGWAEYLLHDCEDHGVRVPEDMAILGLGNTMACETSMVPLSSVDLRLARIGYEAARMLDRVLETGVDRFPDVVVSPGPVVVRDSTATGPIEDPMVASAVKLIRQWLARPFSLVQVADELGCCRRTLENRFKASLGCSMKKYVLERRMEAAGVLLRNNPHLLVNDVIRLTGFQSRTSFLRSFKQYYGCVPIEYRERDA